MPSSCVLSAHGLTKSFGVHRVLDNVSVDLRAGEIHAIIGENGAGKSTLMNIVSGKLLPDTGMIERDGSPIRFSSPSDALRVGIATVPQELVVCPDLTVAENIMLGTPKLGRIGVSWAATRSVALENLSRLDHSISVSGRMGNLSTARQQLVQIARATAANAKVLILDEPTASLAGQEADRLFAFMNAFRGQGGSIFYISHRLDEILALSDRISVLRDGVLICELDPSSTTKDEMVRQMAGRPVTPMPSRPAGQGALKATPALRVSGLARDGEFSDVSFELGRGEILGVSGLVGAGRTELAKCIFGATEPQSGEIEIAGEAVVHRKPADAIANGLVYVPEERKTEGIFSLLSVAENIGIARFGCLDKAPQMRWKKIWAAAQNYAQRLNIRAHSLNAPISALSGGNQQKAILARWLLTDCKVLLLDEPTRGIDVNAKSEIQSILRKLTAQGLSILYISSELQELLEVSDRILVMHEGKIKGCVEAGMATQESLLGIAMS